MRPYVDAARRYAWAIAIVLALVWGTGAYLAFNEYATSYEADATIWTEHRSAQFTSLSPLDPSISSYVTPAQEQAGLLTQLLVTRSFLQQVLDRAAVTRPSGTDEGTFLQDISKRYRVDVLGTNLFRLSYRARDPGTGATMVLAALAVRQERLALTQSETTTAAASFYRSELQVAQDRVVAAQQALDAFDATHPAPLAASDDYTERELRLAVDDARARVTDLRARIDSAATLPDTLRLADALDFQVIDKPLAVMKPSGGLRPAAAIAGAAGAAGLGLAGLLVVVGALFSTRLSRRGAALAGERGDGAASIAAVPTLLGD